MDMLMVTEDSLLSYKKFYTHCVQCDKEITAFEGLKDSRRYLIQ